MLRRQKHVVSQSTTPFACTLEAQARSSSGSKPQWLASPKRIASNAVLQNEAVLGSVAFGPTVGSVFFSHASQCELASSRPFY